ncbi:MAG: hypothetical protein ACXAEJ_11085, partial [Candidatus Thorarchaeota archaeon]
VQDKSVHLILRELGLLELARRQDSDLLDFCECMLSSEDTDEWMVAVKILGALQTDEAVDRLIMVYAQSLSSDRRFVTGEVAKILTANHVHPFTVMARELAGPGEIDVTGWTSVAISTLKDVCKRFGVEVVGDPVLTSERSGNPKLIDLEENTSVRPTSVQK